MDRDIRVSITPGTVFAALLVVAGAYIFWLLRDLALLVLTAIVIASAIEPGIAFFVRQRIPRFFSVLLIYAFIFGSVLSVIYLLFPPIIADAANFLSTLPRYIDMPNIPFSFSSIADAANFINRQQGIPSFVQTLLSFQSVFVAGGSGIIQNLFGGIYSFALVTVLSFYFALQDTGVDDFLRMVMPVKHEEYSVNLWKRSQKKIGLWMQGQILLSIFVGILAYLGLLLLGIPYALLLAVFTAIAELIPVFGSLIAGTIAVMVAYGSGGVPLGLIVAGLFIVVNQFESNLIYPLIVKKIVGVPPLLVIVALIAGYTLAGFLGALLSVPVAAVLLEFITDFDKRKRREPHTGA
jgi:predicted PurR-regulated permease PerM